MVDVQSASEALARRAGQLLMQRRLKCATAESCTGGWIAQVLTSVGGSSAWFERGFVTYSNAAKCQMLGVPGAVLDEHGAVSTPTAAAMAEGALARSEAAIAVAVTGIAGPDGGTADKPVGTVAFAWAMTGVATRTSLEQFTGDRSAIRWRAVEHAIDGLCQQLSRV